MKNYKIVYLLTRFKNAGPINQTYNLIKNLDREVFTPIVVTLFPESPNDSLFYKFQALNIECYDLNLSKKQVLLNDSGKMENLFKEIKPDIIHSVGMVPYKLSLNYKESEHLTTVRNYFHEDYPAKHGKALGTLMAFKDTRLIKKGQNIVTCSKSLSDLYKDKHNLNLPYIRNGVDLSNYKKTNETIRRNRRTELSLPQEKIIAIYTGQFLDRKNQEFAIEGILSSEFKKDIFLILLGNGKNLSTLKRKYSGNSNVLFVGQVEDVERYLQAANFYVSTSKSEGMPNGVLEAMAVGLPLLLSNILQHQEVIEIDEEVGTTYQEGSMASFHSSLKKIKKMNLKKAGQVSYTVANEHLNAELMSLNYQNKYYNIINNN